MPSALRCTQEAELALGVMTHGDRVGRIGHAATAFLAWMTRLDAARSD